MRRSPTTRTTALVAVLALAATGCGLLGSPVYSTPDEVLDALFALQDGAEVRATAELTVDEDEVRGALRDDPEALELFQDAMDGGEAEDVDALLADLEEAQAQLADHAVLLASGADGSARVAAEYRGTVWADLRVGTDLEPDAEPSEGFRFDLQLQVDWATAAEVFDQPDLLGDIDEAAAEIAPFLGDTPEVEPVQRLLVAFLAGELVGIGGEVGPDLLSGLGLGPDELAAATDPGGVLGIGGLDLDHRELAETAFTFDGFRLGGDATVVDVTLEVRAAAELLLDQFAEAPGTMGMTFEDVEEARAELDELPERLTDVATLRFDGAGALQQVRIDVVDVALQLAKAAEPEDSEVAVVERVAAQLDATGLFVVLDVEGVGVGTTETVLGDPDTTVTPEQLAATFGALFLGGLGDGAALPGIEELEGFEDLSESEQQALGLGGSPPAPGLRPDQVAVGDCFDDDTLFGFAPEGTAPTVPCDQPHDNEAFAAIDLGAVTYEELLRDEPDAVACIDEEFEPYVGVGYDQSALIVDVLRPTQEQFEAGVRTSVCYLYGFESLTGSMAGTGT